MDVTLRTARLVLRPQVENDVGALIAGLNDFEVTRYLTVVPFPYTEDDARAWLASQAEPTPARANLAIEWPGDGLIGVVSIGDELGYWLLPGFHGRGIMTEACVGLLDWHFAALPDDVVNSGAHVGNAASLAVQSKLGFVDAGKRSMRHVRSQGREVEHVETTLTRPAFEAARRELGGPRWM